MVYSVGSMSYIMQFFIKICLFIFCISLPGCIINDSYTKPGLTGTWQETGRKCDLQGLCGIKESNTTIAIASDNSIIISSGTAQASFYFKGTKFYRVYSRENNKLSFSFEIMSLTDTRLVIRLFDENLNKKDSYAFRRIASIKKI